MRVQSDPAIFKTGNRQKRPDQAVRPQSELLAECLLLPHLLRPLRHVVEDVVQRVTVQPGLEPLLIEVVPHEADRAADHEQGVEQAGIDHLVDLRVGELEFL